VKAISADNDATRLMSGSAPPGTKLADGPFVLTDGTSGVSNVGWSVFLAPTGDCSQPGSVVANFQGSLGHSDIHGMRVFAPAGAALCAGGGGTVNFSGYHPY